MLSFLEDVGIVKTARREAESLLLAGAIIRNEPIKPANPERIVKLVKSNKVILRAAPLLDLPDGLLNEAKTDFSEAMQLYDLMSEEFKREDISFVVIKSFDSLPDLGHDLDFLLPQPKEFEKARGLLLSKFRVRPQPLTHCDKLVGKFSCYLPGFKHDFELYPTISQLGEQHLEPITILKDRTTATVDGRSIWVTSDLDRVLIRVIHAMFRHNFLKLSDIVDFENLTRRCSTQQILNAVDKADVRDAFVFFVGCIDRFLKACNAESPRITDLKRAGEARFGRDRLSFLQRDRLVLPYRIPTMAIIMIFLLKGAREASRGRWKSSLMCLVTPPLLLLDFVNSVSKQRLLGRRVW